MLNKRRHSFVSWIVLQALFLLPPVSSTEINPETADVLPVQGDKEQVKASIAKLIQEFQYRPEDRCAIVLVSSQRLYLMEGLKILDVYEVSTSKWGVGNEVNSNKTPLGTHRVVEKYGDNAPLGTIFRARSNTGRKAPIRTDGKDSEEDLVTTRILRLRGLEEGVNAGKGIDSYERMIYLHGTPEEGLIGKPASHGCIRMRNQEVIEVYDLLPTGSLVEIQEGLENLP